MFVEHVPLLQYRLFLQLVAIIGLFSMPKNQSPLLWMFLDVFLLLLDNFIQFRLEVCQTCFIGRRSLGNRLEFLDILFKLCD